MSRKGRGSHSRRFGAAREKKRRAMFIRSDESKARRRAFKGITGRKDR